MPETNESLTGRRIRRLIQSEFGLRAGASNTVGGESPFRATLVSAAYVETRSLGGFDQC
jgi:hypothetical protein